MDAEIIIYIDAVNLLTDKVDIEKEVRNRLEYQDDIYFQYQYELYDEESFEKFENNLNALGYDTLMKYIAINIDEIYVNYDESELFDDNTIAYSVPYYINIEQFLNT